MRRRPTSHNAARYPRPMLPTSKPDATIEHQTMCLRCGYELRGLDASGLCPECGFSIAESLERRRLGLSSPAYLSSLRTGALLTIASLIVFVFSGIARSLLFRSFFAVGTQQHFVSLDILASSLLIAGVWMLTIDDPGLHEKDQARPNKRAMRFAAIGLLVLSFAEFLVAMRVPIPMPGPRALTTTSLFAIGIQVGGALWSLACWLILATGLVNYTRWLAVRVPDRRLLAAAQTMSWLLPTALVFAFAASLFFGASARLLPLALMAFFVAAARARIRPDQTS